MVTEINSSNFKTEVLESKIPVLVDFWAEWCGPCIDMAPKFESVSKKFQGKIKFAKLNVDQAGEISGEHGIRSIPCFVLFKDGKEVDRIIGSQSENVFEQSVEQLLKR